VRHAVQCSVVSCCVCYVSCSVPSNPPFPTSEPGGRIQAVQVERQEAEHDGPLQTVGSHHRSRGHRTNHVAIPLCVFIDMLLLPSPGYCTCIKKEFVANEETRDEFSVLLSTNRSFVMHYLYIPTQSIHIIDRCYEITHASGPSLLDPSLFRWRRSSLFLFSLSAALRRLFCICSACDA